MYSSFGIFFYILVVNLSHLNEWTTKALGGSHVHITFAFIVSGGLFLLRFNLGVILDRLILKRTIFREDVVFGNYTRDTQPCFGLSRIPRLYLLKNI